MRNRNDYIDGKAFEAAMIAWGSAPILDRGRMTNSITADYFYPLCENVVATFGVGHIEQEDMVSECVIACVKKMRHFNPKFGTAFNFFTTVIKNEIATQYKRANLPCRAANNYAAPINEQVITVPLNGKNTNGIAVRQYQDFIKRRALTNPLDISRRLATTTTTTTPTTTTTTTTKKGNK